MVERRTFEGGLDTDSAPEFVAKSDYLNMYNMRVGKDSAGRGGAGKPIAGTQQRSTDSATGTKQTIGSITDEVKGRLYRFNFNSNGTDKILAWDRKTNTTYTVLQASNMADGLGFLTAYQITGVAIIGDYLYWTDNINEPRRIDVERGIKTNHPTYTSQNGNVPDPYDTPLNEWDITVARRVPRYPLKWEKLISVDEPDIDDRPINYLDKNGFQFALRYVYSTDEYTTLSCYSKVAPHNTVEEYDTIRVVLDKQEEIMPEVKRIEFLVRRDNIGSWYIIKVFNRDEDEALFDDHNTVGEPELSFLFYNDQIGIPVPDAEAYLPFFDIPILSNALEIADNRVFLGNNVKGYESVDGPDITLGTETISAPATDDWNVFGEYFLLEWSCGTGISEKVVLRIKETYGHLAGWYETAFTSANFNLNSLPTTFIVDQADKYPIVDFDNPPTELFEYLNPTCNTYTFTAYAGTQPELSSVGSFYNSAKAFRQGKTYKVGVIFYDYAGRNAGVTHNVSEIAIPEPVIYETEYVSEITWELTNTPDDIPLWAHSYAICRSRVTEQFLATYTPEVRYGELQDDGTYEWQVYGPHSAEYEAIGVNLSKTIYGRRTGYAFSEGDFMKMINSSNETYYVKIVGTAGEWVLLRPDDIGTTTGNWYIEIITPRVEEDLYWEIGENFRIDDPGTVDRSLSQTTGSLFGDTYFVTLGYMGIIPFPILNWTQMIIPAMNPNNSYWTVWPQDSGRSSSIVFTQQRRYETEVAWSSTYFPGTETNQLNQFVSGDIRTLDSGLGQIQILRLTSRTQDYGTVMLVVGQTEVASLYLGRTEFYNAAETPSLINTVDVIGTVNILRGGFGTINPESFVENDGNAYWYSAIKSAFVMYSKAGVEPISDRKFSVFAAWLGNLILSTANDVPGISAIKIPAGYDDFNKEAVWTIPPIGNWPISYQVMSDVEEDITVTESPVGSVTASLVAGAVYRFTFFAAGPTAVGITCNDMFFGTKTFNSVGTQVSFLFVAASTGNYTFAVTSTPALPTVSHSYTLKKLRLDPYNVLDRYPKTVVFSDEKGRFSWFMNTVPEWWGRIGDRLLSMKLGNLFTHDSATTNSFYGIRYPSNVSIAFNEKPNQVKRLQGVSMEATGQPAYAHFRTEDDFTQSSDLVSTEFRKQEGIWSASARRDRLSPNTPGTVIDKLLKGDEMRGRYVKTLLEWSSLTTFVLKIANLIYRDSHGSKT